MHPIKQALLALTQYTESGIADAALAEWEKIEWAARVLTGFTYDGMPEPMPRNSPTGKAQREAMATLEQVRKEAGK